MIFEIDFEIDFDETQARSKIATSHINIFRKTFLSGLNQITFLQKRSSKLPIFENAIDIALILI